VAGKRTYKRKSNGQFGSGSVAKKTKAKPKGKAVAVKSKTFKKKTGSQAGARAERARLAIKKMKAMGITIAPGTLKEIEGLKKGQSIKLPGGRVITRSKDNTYTITGRKTSAKNNAATKATTPVKRGRKSTTSRARKKKRSRR
jgi:hypothetical protein